MEQQLTLGAVDLVGIFITALSLVANMFIAMLFWRIRRMDEDIEKLKDVVGNMRVNYLDRFEDLKAHNSALHLQLFEKITILDTKIGELFPIRLKKGTVNEQS